MTQNPDQTYRWVDASAYGMRFFMARVHGQDDVVTFVVLEEMRTVAAREDAFSILRKIGYRPLDCFDVAWRRGASLPVDALKAAFPNIVDAVVRREDFARSIRDDDKASNVAKTLHDAITFKPAPRWQSAPPAPQPEPAPRLTRPSAESENSVYAAMGL